MKVAWLFLFAMAWHFSISQTREELEKKRKDLIREIEVSTGILKKTTNTKKASMAELETLQKQIKTRQELIRSLSSEINVYSRSIREKQTNIKSLESDLALLKLEYSKMVYYTYRNQSPQNKLFFIFSSGTFNEAFKRIGYLKRYAQYRREQVNLILKTRDNIGKKLTELSGMKKEKQTLLSGQVEQKKTLTRESGKKDKLISGLKKEEKRLAAAIDQKKKDAQKLDNLIAEVIRKEIEERKKAEAARKSGASSETVKLTSSFNGNKGKLPWPVERGIITGTFGEHPHPVLKGVKIQNNGVDIQTTANAGVRSVFDGEVVEVFFNPSFRNAVMVRHGEFFTVYTNLDEVYVKKGDKVSTRQIIGKILEDAEEGSVSQVHFEIWQGFNKLNPALWIHGN